MSAYEQAAKANERRLIRDSYVLMGLSFSLGALFAVLVMAVAK